MRARTLLSIVALVGAFWNATAHASIIKNGGFETGDFSDWTVTPLIDTPPSDIAIVANASQRFSGSFSAELGADPGFNENGDFVASGAWIDLSQDVHTGRGVAYLISFQLGPDLGVHGGTANGTHVTGIEFPCDINADPECNVLTVDFGGSQVFELSDGLATVGQNDFLNTTVNEQLFVETFDILAYAADRNTVLDFNFFNSRYFIDNISVTSCNSRTCQSNFSNSNNLGLSVDSLILADAPIISAREPSSWTIVLSGLIAFFIMSCALRSRNGNYA